MIDVFADWIALGLANLTNLFDPDTIVLAGGVSADPDLFLPRIDDRARRAGCGARRCARTRACAFAALGPSAGAIGAALLTVD